MAYWNNNYGIEEGLGVEGLLGFFFFFLFYPYILCLDLFGEVVTIVSEPLFYALSKVAVSTENIGFQTSIMLNCMASRLDSYSNR